MVLYCCVWKMAMALYSCKEDCMYTVVNVHVYIQMYSIPVQIVTTRQLTAHLSTSRL
jgi:hypothetical protein